MVFPAVEIVGGRFVAVASSALVSTHPAHALVATRWTNNKIE